MASTRPLPRSDETFRISRLRTPLILMGVFYTIAIGLWQASGQVFYLINFLFVGGAPPSMPYPDEGVFMP